MEQIQSTDNSHETEVKPAKRKKKQRRLRPAFLAGGASFLCALLSLLIGFFRTPALYPVDFGQYELLLRQFGLTWTSADLLAGDLYYTRPLTQFTYTRFSWSNLLTPAVGNSLIYPIALVRLVTEPFGRLFHVDLLAAVLAFILLLAVVLIAASMFRRYPQFWWFPVAVLCLLFTDGNFCAMMRGLYTTGSAIVFTLLHIGMVLYISVLDPSKRAGKLPWLFLTSLLFLKSMTPMIVFLPLLIVSDLYFVWSARKSLSKNLVASGLAAFLGVILLSNAVSFSLSDVDFFSEASAYESFFNTVLPASDDPAGILAEIGLDESYAEDIGKSYYLSDDSYTHNPNDEDEARELFSKLTWQSLIKVYASHPDLLWHNLTQFPYRSDRYESERNSPITANENGFTVHRNEEGVLGFLRFIAHLSYAQFFPVCAISGIAFAFWAFYRKKIKYLIGAVVFFSLPLYLAFVTILNGYAFGSELILYQTFLQDFLAVCVCCVLILAMKAFSVWVTKYSETPTVPSRPFAYVTAPLFHETGKQDGIFASLRQKADEVLSNRKTSALIITGIALAMFMIVYLPKDHVVSVNNGDYGRMMESIGITWSGDMYFDNARQALRIGIEEYAYSEPFDIARLTPLKPSYSLYAFECVIRLFTEPFGLLFSTWKTAILMGIITVFCIGTIVYDLSRKYGKLAFVIGLLLCAMLMSETYLTWFNSLYGEGCILMGMILTVTCIIHLSLNPEEADKKRIIWMVGLAFSMWVMITSKAQMLLALPGCVITFIAFAWFVRPYRYDYQLVHAVLIAVFCVLLVVSGIRVYKTDRDGDSVSQKHTLWQAYFYGIFMISDDPIGDMEKLGIDTAMAPDIGKFVSFDENADYVYSPLSEEAQKGFYDHVSTATIIQWYLMHPAKMLYMLDRAAYISKDLYQDFRVYYGEDYSDPEHDPVIGFNLWPGWRPVFSPSLFLGYVLLYGLLLVLAIRVLIQKHRDKTEKLLAVSLIFVMITGVLQYPLSVLGNGFADNHKQLFGFSLCHDFILCFAVPLFLMYSHNHPLSAEGLSAFRERVFPKKKEEVSPDEKSDDSVRHEAGSDQDVPAGAGA